MIDPVERVVDLVGILENHLHLAQELAPLLAVQLAHVNPAIADLATGRLGETKHQAGKGGLAAAALADNGRDGWRRFFNAERQIVERDQRITAMEDPAPKHLGGMAGFE